LIPTDCRDAGQTYIQKPGRGRKRNYSHRLYFAALVSVLPTGIIWNALPRENLKGLVLRWFALNSGSGPGWCVLKYPKRLLAEYDAPTGIGWHWQAADGTHIEGPPAQGSIGPNPKDPGKNGCKRRVLAGGHGVLCHLPSAAPTGVRACRSIPCSRPD